MNTINANSGMLGASEHLARSEEALRKTLADLQVSHAQLKAAQMELIEAEKIKSIGTLAAGVAHEVKNPLQTILMGLAFLFKNVRGNDKTTLMVLTDMLDAVKRADAIVRDLLCLSASRHLELQMEDLNGVVEQALVLVRYELTRGRISVSRALATHLPPALLDKAKMEQVFINLFLNAIHAMPDGGSLTVRTSSGRAGEMPQLQELTPSRFRKEDLVIVTEVEDTGKGIADEDLPKIFDPFFTTKPPGVGTGLGLPVTKQIVDLHRGSIDIRPAGGGGVKATMILRGET